MFAWRWPAIFHYKPVNPDEAQFLAGAITMLARDYTEIKTAGSFHLCLRRDRTVPES